MKGFINNFMAIAGLFGIVFGAYVYITDKPVQGIKEARADLQEQIKDTETVLRREMKERREQRDKEIADFKLEIRNATGTLMNKLEKIDDRLYEIQRAQAQQNAGTLFGEPDGG